MIHVNPYSIIPNPPKKIYRASHHPSPSPPIFSWGWTPSSAATPRRPGVGKCPMTWEYWTSPEIVAISSHLVDHQYRSWLGDVKHGDMTNDQIDKSWSTNPFDSPFPTKIDRASSPSAGVRRPEIWWTPFPTAPPSSPVVPPSAGHVPWSYGRWWPTGDPRRMWWRWMRGLAAKNHELTEEDGSPLSFYYIYIYRDPMI